MWHLLYMTLSCCGYLLVVMGLGCASPRAPVYVDPSFSPMDVRAITVLPALDMRQDRNVRVDEPELQKLVAGVLGRILRQKHYGATFSSEFWARPCVEADAVVGVDVSCVRNLRPKEATWVLLVFLEDLQKRTAFGSGVSAEVSGLLIDASRGTIVWRDSGYRRLGQGGMVGLAMDGLLDHTVLEESLDDLMKTFPERTKSPENY